MSVTTYASSPKSGQSSGLFGSFALWLLEPKVESVSVFKVERSPSSSSEKSKSGSSMSRSSSEEDSLAWNFERTGASYGLLHKMSSEGFK
jgi:hypothetical protein